MQTDPLPSQRDLFDLPREVAYLNCAYMGPLPRATRQAAIAAASRKARPWEITPPDFFTEVEALRGRVAALLGADADGVALVPSASYGMAIATRNLPLATGQRVILVEEDFPSVVYPWRRRARDLGAEVVCIPRPADDDWTSAILAAIDARTAIAALPLCHWTDGAHLDLQRIAARLREVGAALVIDGTQAIGAMPFDLQAVAPDILVVAGYKWLLGPYALSYAWIAPRWRDGTPVEENWMARAGSDDFARLVQYQDAYRPGARRYDMGEVANFASVAPALASLDLLLSWGVDRIQETLRAKTRRLANDLAPLGLASAPEHLRVAHYLGLRAPRGLPPAVLTRLRSEGVHVSVRGTAIRITPHVYNDEMDLDRCVLALTEALDRRHASS